MQRRTLYDLLADYEATMHKLRGEGHPDAEKYAELVKHTRQIIAQFERSPHPWYGEHSHEAY